MSTIGCGFRDPILRQTVQYSKSVPLKRGPSPLKGLFGIVLGVLAASSSAEALPHFTYRSLSELLPADVTACRTAGAINDRGDIVASARFACDNGCPQGDRHLIALNIGSTQKGVDLGTGLTGDRDIFGYELTDTGKILSQDASTASTLEVADFTVGNFKQLGAGETLFTTLSPFQHAPRMNNSGDTVIDIKKFDPAFGSDVLKSVLIKADGTKIYSSGGSRFSAINNLGTYGGSIWKLNNPNNPSAGGTSIPFRKLSSGEEQLLVIQYPPYVPQWGKLSSVASLNNSDDALVTFRGFNPDGTAERSTSFLYWPHGATTASRIPMPASLPVQNIVTQGIMGFTDESLVLVGASLVNGEFKYFLSNPKTGEAELLDNLVDNPSVMADFNPMAMNNLNYIVGGGSIHVVDPLGNDSSTMGALVPKAGGVSGDLSCTDVDLDSDGVISDGDLIELMTSSAYQNDLDRLLIGIVLHFGEQCGGGQKLTQPSSSEVSKTKKHKRKAHIKRSKRKAHRSLSSKKRYRKDRKVKSV